MSDNGQIDWQGLAERLSSLGATAGGLRTEHGSTALARAAVEQLVGPNSLAGAVDHYVAMKPGFELARSILWLLRPWSAMVRCRELFASRVDIQVRRSSIELLRVVADRRALPWVEEFLADPDPEIQCWAIGIVDQLVFASLVDSEECGRVLALAQIHDNARVRQAAAEITAQIQASG